MQQLEAVRLWERALAYLPDSIFLDIVRNFLGRVPTPFHKPQLATQLTSLFTQEQFQQQLIARLSPTDVHMISAVIFLEHPTQEELGAIFEIVLPYATVRQHLVNLEARLLLVPDPTRSVSEARVMVNPLLQEHLIARCPLQSLFGLPATDAEAHRYGFLDGDHELIRSLMSLHIHANLGGLERSERLLHSRYMSPIFGAQETWYRMLISNYNRLLFQQRCVKEHGRKVIIHADRMTQLLKLDAHALWLSMCCSSWMYHYGQTHDQHRATLPMVQGFFSVLSRLLEIISIQQESELQIAIRLAAFSQEMPIPSVSDILPFLFGLGLVWRSVSDHRAKHTVAEPRIDSDLTVSYSGTLPSGSSANLLHMIAHVNKVDVMNRYEISRVTMMRAFDLGLDVEEILQSLENLTATLFASLKNLMHQWRQEYASLTIYDGIVVKADERQSRIIEALPALQPYIVSRIMSGCYLFSRKHELQWRELLASAGSGLLPSSITESEEPSVTDIPQGPIFDDTPLYPRLQHLQQISDHSVPHHRDPSDEDQLRKLIITKARGADERREMLDRLERKLILIPSQVQAVQGPSQSVQASGFDHQGKINLCKTAIQSKSDLLEIHLLDEDETPQVMLAEAKELINATQEASLRVSVLPLGEELVIPIHRIFKVRKLKRSIFFQS